MVDLYFWRFNNFNISKARPFHSNQKKSHLGSRWRKNSWAKLISTHLCKAIGRGPPCREIVEVGMLVWSLDMFTLTLEKLTAGSKKWRRMEEEIHFWKPLFSGSVLGVIRGVSIFFMKRVGGKLWICFWEDNARRMRSFKQVCEDMFRRDKNRNGWGMPGGNRP